MISDRADAHPEVSPLAASVINGVEVPLQLLDPLVGLIYSGVLARHPDLRVVLAESGIAWLPYVLQRMDNEHRKYVEARATWEKRNPGGIRHTPLIEVFGGYAFARLDGGGGTGTNLNGGMGSVGWNFKPWLQVVADSSYSVVTISGTKNVLYGNHFGPRYFHRGRNRWGATPFVEALVGGSRADTTVTGTGGYTTSVNCLSYKVGGGLDLHPSRRWEIRLFDVDYYRTSFGTGVHQNNYWATTGIVLRLFGGAE